MSGFNTKERNNYGEYEITFYTENRQEFEKVQDLCRELIDHNKGETQRIPHKTNTVLKRFWQFVTYSPSRTFTETLNELEKKRG